ncbi:hypothetical protein [Brachyspira pilosicoli]|uniref:hypothetical protein n=1 Tax=Brachyspira pilosicoli TaxID=52584 RepID=UPI002543BFE2|nr:hypothetical protein [Brachyspira pilosicoli]WIH80403.1 hypothetical protein NEI04_06225 [Brachyspira pilosicoli]
MKIKIYLKIYALFVVIFAVSIIVLSFLGKKERVGYLSDFKLNIDKTLEINGLDINEVKQLFTINEKIDEVSITNYIFTNTTITNYNYDFRIKYYDKVFRNSDIYDVYIDVKKAFEDNEYIKEITMSHEGSPFGYFISDNQIDEKKIDDIIYTLKIKKVLISSVINILFIVMAAYFIINFDSFKFKNIYIFNNIKNKEFNNKIFIVLVVLILLFSIMIRIYWANQKELLHHDEYQTISFSNNQDWISINIDNIQNTSGYDILKQSLMPNSSIKDCLDDIKKLYINSNDPQISNLYYSFFRLFFIGNDTIDIKEIIIIGTILNCIFFIISFIFLYKISKLLFDDKKDYIIFSLFIMSLSPASLSISHFLRPYQMQEMFFIVITYIVINTIYYDRYSFINLVITSIITGIGYLILTSSFIYIFILSLMLFINYLLTLLENKYKLFFLSPLINIKSYKIILYYAFAFISALFISRIIYSNFFGMLFNNTDRALNTILFSKRLFYFINTYAFNGFLIFLFVLILEYIFLIFLERKKYYFNIDKNKLKLIFFIVILSFMYALFSDLLSPYKTQLRYTVTSYLLIIFLFPLIFILVNINNKLRYFIFIVISIFYIYKALDYNSFYYFYKKDANLDVLKDNISVYCYNIFLGENIYTNYSLGYLNTNLYYTYIDSEKGLYDIKDNKFYFLVNNNILDYNNIFSNYNRTKLSSYQGVDVFLLENTNYNGR